MIRQVASLVGNPQLLTPPAESRYRSGVREPELLAPPESPQEHPGLESSLPAEESGVLTSP